MRTSGFNYTDDTAIENDRFDLQTCRVSKQRHHLATSWCKSFGPEHRHVAVSIASSTCVVSIVSNHSIGSHAQKCLDNNHFCEY